MALIQVSYGLLEDVELCHMIVDSFDTIQEVADNKLDKYKVFRVSHPEIPKEDIVICPEVYTFDRIKPFIISFQ